MPFMYSKKNIELNLNSFLIWFYIASYPRVFRLQTHWMKHYQMSIAFMEKKDVAWLLT